MVDQSPRFGTQGIAIPAPDKGALMPLRTDYHHQRSRVSTGFLGASLGCRRQISTVTDILLQSLCGQIASSTKTFSSCLLSFFRKSFISAPAVSA
jgi:hypothetical protein